MVGVGHAFAQAPQFEGSKAVSVHTAGAPHAVCPDAQLAEHAPATHAVPPGHAVPHAPQFWLSVWRFVQVLEHSVSPDWQLTAHLPAEHTSPEGHAAPHAPQFWRSACRLVQVPLHSVKPC